MLTNKQRAYLRSLSNEIPSIFQVGKAGINQNLIQQINDALEAREIVKINVLKNAPDDADSVCAELSEKTESEPVHVIGNKIVLYKCSKKKQKIFFDNL